ncbi:MAG TPA: hypothetical protein VMC08_00795, partial [Bacteroidales bacterium]|nr:hypothetical protein [Bacteroidales bacterium]
SRALLASRGFSNITVSGDTRFDRVYEVVREPQSIPFIEKFSSGQKILIAGSSWPPDEKVFFPFIRNLPANWKFIIAPHEVHAERIRSLAESLSLPVLKFSEAEESNLKNARILVIDSIGLLSRLYRYATVAYVGGAFGSGLHNILEPAAFGVPVIFGPGYGKNPEAGELIGRKGAFPVRTPEEFNSLMAQFDRDASFLKEAGEACRTYVFEQKGATRKILEKIHV